MRLVGATPRQISVVSAVEAVVAALAGVAVGFALFFVFRPLLYQVPFTGAPFSAGDLSLHGIDIVLAVIGIPVAAVVSARLALRRVQISPLGVTRRESSRPPRMVRIIPLLAGVAVLAYFDAHGKPVAAVSIVVGLVSAALYLHSQVAIAFRIPGIDYWATVLGGLAASLAIIASTFPLLNRMTGPEVARND